MTAKEQVVERPAESIAVYVTGVEPVWNELPGWIEEVTVGVSKSSVAVGAVQKTDTWLEVDGKFRVITCGQLKSWGGWLPVVPGIVMKQRERKRKVVKIHTTMKWSKNMISL